MSVTNKARSQLGPNAETRGRFRYSLRTLLAALTLSAASFAVGRYTSMTAAVAIIGAVAVGACIGVWVAGTEEGLARGAVYGFQFSLLAVVLATAYCLYRGHVRERSEGNRHPVSTISRSPEESYQVIRSLVPSARRVTADSNIEDVLGGHYAWDVMGLVGAELFLFPDGTFFFLEWADIFPTTICDKGNWEFQNGLVVLRTDDTIDRRIGHADNIFLPLIATRSEMSAVSTKKSERIHLLGMQQDLESYLKSAPDSDSEGVFLQLSAYSKTKTIPAHETQAIKYKLFASYAPEELRWQFRGASCTKASALMLAVSAALFALLRRKKRRVHANEMNGR
jgi:hypothetical protein